MRPLGIPAYEDKLVQGVMRKVLDQIYERKFNLELAEDKSKIIRFGRFAKQNSKDGKTENFVYGPNVRFI